MVSGRGKDAGCIRPLSDQHVSKQVTPRSTLLSRDVIKVQVEIKDLAGFLARLLAVDQPDQPGHLNINATDWPISYCRVSNAFFEVNVRHSHQFTGVALFGCRDVPPSRSTQVTVEPTTDLSQPTSDTPSNNAS